MVGDFTLDLVASLSLALLTLLFLPFRVWGTEGVGLIKSMDETQRFSRSVASWRLALLSSNEILVSFFLLNGSSLSLSLTSGVLWPPKLVSCSSSSLRELSISTAFDFFSFSAARLALFESGVELESFLGDITEFVVTCVESL